jgi:alkanesulfonate monooxygenase SsuD/methylene tetrahydromethanopterin reductase-like flavin-dependent oxidoreductase (luciferase family)
VQSALPVLWWYAENPSAAGTTAGTRTAIFYDGELYDNVWADIHGQSSRGFPKKSFNIDFPKGHRFELAGDIRRTLAGERVPLAVATGARPLKLNLAPKGAVPIYLAALTDESVRLAGELADGWLPFLYPRRCLVQGIALLREGAARSSDPGRRVSVYPTVPTVVADHPAEARAGAAWFVSFYLTTMGPLYRRSLARQGFGREIDAVLAANSPKFTGEVPAAADSLLEELTAFGTPAEARERLAQWHAAGADMPLVFLRPNLTPEQIERTLSAFGPMLESRA